MGASKPTQDQGSPRSGEMFAIGDDRPDVPKGQVLVTEHDHAFTRHVYSDDHHWLADEPTAMGGNNQGPDPYEHLLAALGTCTSMTIRMYANHKQWPITLDDRMIDNIDHMHV